MHVCIISPGAEGGARARGTEMKKSHADLVEQAHKRAVAGARMNAAVIARTAYCRKFAEAFQNCYAEMFAEELEEIGG